MLQDQNFYNKPVRSLQTMLRSLAHTDENYRSVIPDGVYGPETHSAVSTFQRKHALPVTGIVNHETWEHIVTAYNISLIDTDPAWPIITDIAVGEVFRKGDQHPYVFLIQSMLGTISEVYHAISKPEITGIMDDPSVISVSEFQVLNDLPMTGNVDKRTWKHLTIHYPVAVTRSRRNGA